MSDVSWTWEAAGAWRQRLLDNKSENLNLNLITRLGNRSNP